MILGCPNLLIAIHDRCSLPGIYFQPLHLVAWPDDQIEPINRGAFRGAAKTTIRLDCSITPGVLVDQYYVTWRSASNQSLVFYQSFPPHLKRNPINIDSQHYSVDPGNFSLYIHNVTPADGAHEYVCVLGVEDPMDLDSTLLYTHTGNFHLSLCKFMSSDMFADVDA